MINNDAYKTARQRYLEIGVDTELAMSKLDNISVSMNCWQGDDVLGFENCGKTLSGGIQTTGSYPGRARDIDELIADIDKAVSLIPGKLKLNLHAMYGDFKGENVDRDQIDPKHFEKWVAFAKERNMGLDFNPTLFSHEKSEAGFTLSSRDEEIRGFWIEHCKATRRVSEYFGKKLGTPSVNNIWIPDGFKDTPVDRYDYRMILKDSLDKIFSEKLNPGYNLDAVEGKLFGIGSESCVIGSNDFYLAYATRSGQLLTLDTGHFHPTEQVSDKLSTALLFVPGVLLHVSRPVRWDSDHVVVFDEELKNIACEIIRNGFESRVYIGLDFFDASINRLAAWVIGVRNMKKALLAALLEPFETLRKAERDGDYTTRLALLEELKTFPMSAVWDQYCLTRDVPIGLAWIKEVKDYENDVLSKRLAN